MKYEGMLSGVPVYSSPDCPPDVLYMLDENAFERILPKRKDGKPDMRYKVNKLDRLFNH